VGSWPLSLARVVEWKQAGFVRGRLLAFEIACWRLEFEARGHRSAYCAFVTTRIVLHQQYPAPSHLFLRLKAALSHTKHSYSLPKQRQGVIAGFWAEDLSLPTSDYEFEVSTSSYMHDRESPRPPWEIILFVLFTCIWTYKSTMGSTFFIDQSMSSSDRANSQAIGHASISLLQSTRYCECTHSLLTHLYLDLKKERFRFVPAIPQSQSLIVCLIHSVKDAGTFERHMLIAHQP
jgi:hypothetical protein